MRAMRVLAAALPFAIAGASCDSLPQTSVVIDNGYAPSATNPAVVYRAYWETTYFVDPIAPGTSSDTQATIPASTSPAYVVLAPGWDPELSAQPESLVVLQSKSGFDVHLGGTVHIPVDDDGFAGNCAAGSHLTQDQADFITGVVFPDVFATYTYDAATCTATPIGDAGTD
jgi:hypothetical protein